MIGTSFGFAFLSATAAAGSSARLRSELELLGGVTVVASALTFALLAGGLWRELLDDEWLWRLFGSVLIVTVAGSHACLVLMATAAIDSFFGILAVSGLAEDVDEGFAQLLAVLVVILLFSTLVPPILRRLQRPGEAPAGFAGEVLAIADRIDELGSGPVIRTPEIRRETARLTRLARGQTD